MSLPQSPTATATPNPTPYFDAKDEYEPENAEKGRKYYKKVTIAHSMGKYEFVVGDNVACWITNDDDQEMIEIAHINELYQDQPPKDQWPKMNVSWYYLGSSDIVKNNEHFYRLKNYKNDEIKREEIVIFDATDDRTEDFDVAIIEYHVKIMHKYQDFIDYKTKHNNTNNSNNNNNNSNNNKMFTSSYMVYFCPKIEYQDKVRDYNSWKRSTETVQKNKQCTNNKKKRKLESDDDEEFTPSKKLKINTLYGLLLDGNRVNMYDRRRGEHFIETVKKKQREGGKTIIDITATSEDEDDDIDINDDYDDSTDDTSDSIPKPTSFLTETQRKKQKKRGKKRGKRKKKRNAKKYNKYKCYRSVPTVLDNDALNEIYQNNNTIPTDHVATPENLMVYVQYEMESKYGKTARFCDVCPMHCTRDNLNWKEWIHQNSPFVNSPFSTNNQKKWMEQSVLFCKMRKLNVYFLTKINASGSQYWREMVFPNASKVVVFRKNFSFIGYDKNTPFATALIVFDAEKAAAPESNDNAVGARSTVLESLDIKQFVDGMDDDEYKEIVGRMKQHIEMK